MESSSEHRENTSVRCLELVNSFEQQFNFQLVTLDLSVMSMLAEPNTESPANVDAAKMWREDRSFDCV